MKTLKNILFVTIISLLITSCTDTTEDLVINKKDHVENTTISGKYDTGGDSENKGTGKDK